MCAVTRYVEISPIGPMFGLNFPIERALAIRSEMFDLRYKPQNGLCVYERAVTLLDQYPDRFDQLVCAVGATSTLTILLRKPWMLDTNTLLCDVYFNRQSAQSKNIPSLT